MTQIDSATTYPAQTLASKLVRGYWRAFLVPAGALLTFVGLHQFGMTGPGGGALFASVIILPVLIATVLTAVYHAEKVAHKLGQPYGTLVLTISVTVIEVALIMSIILHEEASSPLARDTIFSVIMIVCNGLVGVCILVGGIRFKEQDFETQGANAYLAIISALSILCLILPSYTTSTPGPTLTHGQLAFVSVVTILLYCVFMYIQTVRHTDYFTEAGEGSTEAGLSLPEHKRPLVIATVLLVLSLAGVVLLAETFTASVQAGLLYIGAPVAAAGFFVALLILMPETISAFRAAEHNELQRSLNLSLGSSLATIGLTIPAVAVISLYLDRDLILGLRPDQIVLLAGTLLVSGFTFGTGRTNILYGFIHMIIFATYVFLIFVP